MPLLPVLLTVREGQRWRLGADRAYLPAETVYTKYVCEELSSVPFGIPPEVQTEGPHAGGRCCGVREWHEQGMSMHMHVIGVALLEPLRQWSIQSCLSKAEKAVRKYWLVTRHGAEHLFFVRVREVHQLRQALMVHTGNLVTQLFQMCTDQSAEAVGHAETTSGERVRSIVARWTTQFGFLSPSQRGDTDMRLLLFMPAAHAVLLAWKKWSTYAFPIMPTARARAGLGLSLLKGFLPRPGALEQIRDANKSENPLQLLLGSDTLEQTADTIRSMMAGLPAPVGVHHQLEVLQAAADQIYLDSHRRSTKAFEMDFLIRCLVAGGHLKSQHNLAEALRHAIMAAVRNEDLRSHLLLQMRKDVVPSTTTLYRHRLTLHIGFCLWLARLSDAMLAKPRGVVRFATADSSPQGRFDWILCGATTIAVDEMRV